MILLGASVTVRNLFADIGGRARLLEAAEPRNAVRLIEEELRIPRAELEW